MCRAAHLGVQDAGEVGRAGPGERAVLRDAGRVDHAGQQRLRGQRREQAGHRVAVGDVAGGDRDLHAQVFQFLGQLCRAGRGRAAAAGEHQVLSALAGEPAGDLSAEPARSAGDQDGAGRGPGALGVVAGEGMREAANAQFFPAHRELVLVRAAGQRGD